MLDFFTIFNKRGIVLFSYPSSTKLQGAPVDRLIKDVLLEERSGENSYSLDDYALKWTFANEFDLIFVVCHFNLISSLNYLMKNYKFSNERKNKITCNPFTKDLNIMQYTFLFYLAI